MNELSQWTGFSCKISILTVPLMYLWCFPFLSVRFPIHKRKYYFTKRKAKWRKKSKIQTIEKKKEKKKTIETNAGNPYPVWEIWHIKPHINTSTFNVDSNKTAWHKELKIESLTVKYSNEIISIPNIRHTHKKDITHRIP